MSIRRTKHTATLLQNGTVLIVGGKQADIFDPATELFTAVPSLPLNRLWQELPAPTRQQALRLLRRVLGQQLLTPPNAEEVAHEQR